MINKRLPLKGIMIGILILRPLKAGGVLDHGFTLRETLEGGEYLKVIHGFTLVILTILSNDSGIQEVRETQTLNPYILNPFVGIFAKRSKCVKESRT